MPGWFASPARASRRAAASGAPRVGRVQGLAEVGLAIHRVREPARDRPGRPGGVLVLVTAVAGVGGAERHREVRPRDPQAVIRALVHHHIEALGHVTGDAGRTGGALGVVVMGRGVVAVGLVAAGAECVALGLELQAVGLVTVGADHALVVHAALDEGAVVEDLVLDLAVREVQVRLQQGEPKALVQGLAGREVLPDAPAPGMAAGAGLGLDLGGAGQAARRFAGGGVSLPLAAVAVLEIDRQTPRRGSWAPARQSRRPWRQPPPWPNRRDGSRGRDRPRRRH